MSRLLLIFCQVGYNDWFIVNQMLTIRIIQKSLSRCRYILYQDINVSRNGKPNLSNFPPLSMFHHARVCPCQNNNIPTPTGRTRNTYSLVTEKIINSLAPGKFEWNFRHVIFKQILVIDGWGISCEIALIWMSLDFTDDQSTLVQVMAWCRQATSHYLSQCWPRSLSPYGVTGPQWVNRISFETFKAI